MRQIPRRDFRLDVLGTPTADAWGEPAACISRVEKWVAGIAKHDKWLAGEVADRELVTPCERRRRRQDRAEFILHQRSGLHAWGGKLYQRHIDHLRAEFFLKRPFYGRRE